jgi:hypothetical protein
MLFSNRKAKLKTRFDRVQKAKFNDVEKYLWQFWSQLLEDTIFCSILSDLELHSHKDKAQSFNQNLSFATNAEDSALNAYAIIKSFIESGASNFPYTAADQDQAKELAQDIYEYVTEKIGDVDFTLGKAGRGKPSLSSL